MPGDVLTEIKQLESAIVSLEGRLKTLKSVMSGSAPEVTSIEKFSQALEGLRSRLSTISTKGLFSPSDVSTLAEIQKGLRGVIAEVEKLKATDLGGTFAFAGVEGATKGVRRSANRLTGYIPKEERLSSRGSEYKIINLAEESKTSVAEAKAFNRGMAELSRVAKHIADQYKEQDLVAAEGLKLSRKLLAAQRIADERKAESLAREQQKVEEAGGRLQARLLQRKLKAEEKNARLAEEEAKQRELHNRLINDPRYAQALEQASKLGFAPTDAREILDKGGGIQRVEFARRGDDGINRRAQFYVDPTGKSTPGLSSQFRMFTSGIVRDIGEFTKWSLAVTAVYAPLRALSQLSQDMVTIENALADSAIAANIEFDKTGEVFDRVKTSARGAGEGIIGVIDAYSQAYRATGRYSDENTRNEKTTKLLNASLILSKLSTLDQSQAIDTLSAALLQSGSELDRGEKLLNKWVRVSQIANVTVDTLATGVAVLGDSAESAGLSVDHLNGLIAVLSEQSISGSKEAANTAKALIGAYQSDAAEKVLSRYGFALRRANGEVRDFLDVYRDLAKAQKEGILSEANISEIATALGGGGSRRAKDVAALISNYDRLAAIARESGLVTDDSTLAQDALAKKMQTVETATTRMNNAFQSLAHTLGDDGGLLDYFRGFLNILSLVTEGVDALFGAMGRSGPVFATMTASMLALSRFPESRVQTILSLLGGQPGMGGKIASTEGMTGWRAFAGNVLLQNQKGMLPLAALSVGVPAVGNLLEGESDRAAGNAIGGVIGAAIGSAFGGMGTVIGANIGSVIGESFVRKVVEAKPTWENIFIEFRRAGEETKPKDTEDKRQALLEGMLEHSGYKTYQGAQFDAALLNIRQKVREFFGTNEFAKGTKFTPEYLIYSNLDPAYRAKLDEERKRQLAREAGGEPIDSQNYAALREQLQAMAVAEREKQFKRMGAGEITPTEFSRVTEQLSGFPAVAIKGSEAFGDEMERLSETINNTTDVYQSFLYLTTYGSQEQIDQVSKFTTDIEYLKTILSTFSSEDIGLKLKLSFGEYTIESKKQLEELLNNLSGEYATATLNILGQIQKAEQARNEALQKKNEPEGLDFRKFNVPMSTLESMARQSLEIGQSWAEKFNYNFKPEDQIAISQEGIVKPLHADFKILALLLEKIVDQNQKQLDGMYNIPEGATFWVPLTAAYYRNKGGGDGLNPNGFTEKDLKMDTSQLDAASMSLKEAAGKLDSAGLSLIQAGSFFSGKYDANTVAEKRSGFFGGQYNIDDVLKNKAIQRRDELERIKDEIYPGSLPKTIEGTAKAPPIVAHDITSGITGFFQRLFGIRDTAGFGFNPSPLLTKPVGMSLPQHPSAQQANPVATKLDLKMESTTNLVVDGRVLASIVKPFLAADLLKSEATQGTISKRYVI